MDIIANALTKVRNAQKVKKDIVTIMGNKLLLEVCRILKDKGYVEEYHHNTKENKNLIDITLKYDSKGSPVISKITRVSHCSRRVYKKAAGIPRIVNGLATVIVSTSKGVLTGKEAEEKGVGGEVICYVL